MQLSTAVASGAMILAVVLAAGYAQGDPAIPKVATQHEKAQDREAKRRADILEHEKRKAELARRCIRPLDVPANLEACRTAYRQM